MCEHHDNTDNLWTDDQNSHCRSAPRSSRQIWLFPASITGLTTFHLPSEEGHFNHLHFQHRYIIHIMTIRGMERSAVSSFLTTMSHIFLYVPTMLVVIITMTTITMTMTMVMTMNIMVPWISVPYSLSMKVVGRSQIWIANFL